MKIKILLTLLISTISYAQISLNDMKSILKMDYDSFETFAMNKGFVFNKICKNDEECVNYGKGKGDKTKYITLYTKLSKSLYKKKVNYQTYNETEYLLIKKQMKEQGFRLLDSSTSQKNGQFFKLYQNKKYQVLIGIGKNNSDTVYDINILELSVP